ncbi:MAG: tetratricopeptide repeat protein [Ignavibacteria bacterium]
MGKEEAERLNDRGKILGRGMKHVEAVEYFSAAVDMCPEEGKYRYNMGIALKRMKRNDEALRNFLDALKLGYEHADCYCSIGELLCARQEFELEEPFFDEAIMRDPDSVTAYEERATAYCRIGKSEKALEDMNLLISKIQDDCSLYLIRGLILSVLGRKEESKKDFEKVKEIFKRAEGGKEEENRELRTVN